MEHTIILYHTLTCPQCKMIEKLLKDNQITYESCVDVNVIRAKNILHVPVLEVDGEQLVGKAIFNWIKEGAAK